MRNLFGQRGGSYSKCVRMVYESLSLLWVWPWGVLEGRTGILAMADLFVCRPERYNCNYFDERAIIILL